MMLPNKFGVSVAAAAAALTVGLVSTDAQAVPSTAKVIFVVDESGSMSGEHAFLGDVIGDLDTALGAAGIGTRQYGLVGYGASNPAARDVGAAYFSGSNGYFMDATQFSQATANLVTSGGLEDGYDGLDFGLDEFAFNAGEAVNFVLVTDEDRDVFDATLSKSGIESDLAALNALLNVIVDADLEDGSGNTALGIDAEGNAHLADGSGGYTTAAGGTAVSGFGSTIADYIDLALDTGGAAWDLNQLRAGGLLAESFAASFIDIKVGEIQNQEPIPEPASLAMLSVGLIGLGGLARRRRKA